MICLVECPGCPADFVSNLCGFKQKSGRGFPVVPGTHRGIPTTNFLYVHCVYHFLVPVLRACAATPFALAVRSSACMIVLMNYTVKLPYCSNARLVLHTSGVAAPYLCSTPCFIITSILNIFRNNLPLALPLSLKCMRSERICSRINNCHTYECECEKISLRWSIYHMCIWETWSTCKRECKIAKFVPIHTNIKRSESDRKELISNWFAWQRYTTCTVIPLNELGSRICWVCNISPAGKAAGAPAWESWVCPKSMGRELQQIAVILQQLFQIIIYRIWIISELHHRSRFELLRNDLKKAQGVVMSIIPESEI